MMRAKLASICALGFLAMSLTAGSGLAADWWGKSSSSKDKEQKRYQVQMRTQLNAYDPQFLLAMEKDLNLSDNQIDKLEEMVDNSREDAKDILTKDQLKELDKQVGTDTYTLNKLYDKVGKGAEGSSGMGRHAANDESDVAMCRGLSGSSMRQCQALANAKISSYDPQFLLAYSRELNLSDGQIKRLDAIVQDDRQEARRLLSREQRNQLEGFSRSTETMSDFRREGSRSESRWRDESQDGDGSFQRTRVIDMADGNSGGTGGGMTTDHPMMMRYRGMMQSQIDPFDPQFVLALKKDLNLSEGQVQKIQSVIESERDSIKKVLNSEQTSKLNQLSQTPNSMVQMQREMMDRLCRGAGGASGDGEIGTGSTRGGNDMQGGNNYR